VSAAALQLLAWSAAFWLALALHARREPGASLRLAVGLLLGACLAHAGAWLGWQPPQAGFPVRVGASVLFVPFGLLAARTGPAAFASLPLPLAVARLGCVAAGCCRGEAGELLPLWEFALLVALHLGLARGALAVAPERFALGFGALRLAEASWRPPVPHAGLAGLATPEAVALGWIALGTWLALRRSVTEPGRSRHASVTGTRCRSGSSPA
jgi:hypothetical protein